MAAALRRGRRARMAPRRAPLSSTCAEGAVGPPGRDAAAARTPALVPAGTSGRRNVSAAALAVQGVTTALATQHASRLGGGALWAVAVEIGYEMGVQVPKRPLPRPPPDRRRGGVSGAAPGGQKSGDWAGTRVAPAALRVVLQADLAQRKASCRKGRGEAHRPGSASTYLFGS